MGLFSSSDSTTTNQPTTQNAGFSDIGGPALALQGNDNYVQFTDQGALKVAGQIAEQAFDQVEIAGAQAAAGIEQAVAAVAESNREETENLVGNLQTVAIFGVVAWAAVKVFGR